MLKFGNNLYIVHYVGYNLFENIFIRNKYNFFFSSGHNYPIWCMDTSIFNLYIATGSHDRTAKLWSLDRKFPLRIFAGHFLDVNVCKNFVNIIIIIIIMYH